MPSHSADRSGAEGGGIGLLDPWALSEDEGRLLAAHAREAVAAACGAPVTAAAPPRPPWMERWGASFVTLMQGERLRGCVGTLRAYRAVVEDVRDHAVAAALRDTRFPPLTAEEATGTSVEVSLLSPLVPLRVASEEELLEILRPEEDGLLLELGGFRATFLPQVWLQIPEREEFVRHLKRKAGLGDDAWSPKVRLWRYRVRKVR